MTSCHPATIQVSLTAEHGIGSYDYMDRLRHRLALELPDVSAFLQSGGLQDAVLNRGLPAPIDIQNAVLNYELGSLP